MADIAKIVGAPPSPPTTPNTLFCVRVGVGFDLYMSNSDGTAVHKNNSGWVEMTQAAYDALSTKDPNILYVIVG